VIQNYVNLLNHVKLAARGLAGEDAGVNEGSRRDEEAVARFVEQFALQWAEAGFPRMAARVFVTLLVAESGRCTAAELAEQLRVSPAAISGAVRYLNQVGLVVRERAPGERRDHYRMSDDMWYETCARENEMLKRWSKDLAEGIKAVGRDTPAASRLDETRRFFEFVAEEFPTILERWREVRATPAD
jgi:DNA-binding transcriptional regulator GbsR (MarR family)